MILRGKKVILREKRLGDAAQDYAWRTDEELARLDANLPLKTRFDDFKEFYAEELEYPTPHRCRFAVDDLTGKHIGNCMYYGMDKSNGQVEVGIMIGDKAYWGRGYGADAVMTLLDYLFTEEKMKRVYLHTLEWNERAQRSFEKCGFVACDRVKRDRHTFIVMEIFRKQWETRQNNPALSGAE
ncbi:MAG: GNAT family N-acetyltransferase [Dehalococcoidia bacterium]